MTDEKTTREQLEEAFEDKQLKREFPGRVYSRSELSHATIEIPADGGQPTFLPVEPPFEGGSSTLGPGAGPGGAGPGSEPGSGGAGGQAQPMGIDEVSAASHQAAAIRAGGHGFGMITITYDAIGSYRFRCSNNLDVTKAVGYLFRSILSLQQASDDNRR